MAGRGHSCTLAFVYVSTIERNKQMQHVVVCTFFLVRSALCSLLVYLVFLFFSRERRLCADVSIDYNLSGRSEN